jgi:hypothetical protein
MFNLDAFRRSAGPSVPSVPSIPSPPEEIAFEASARFPSLLLTVRDWCSAQRIPRPAPRNKRAFMRLAYRQQYKCAHCNELMHPDSQADHIVPWSLTGDDADGNIQILCPNCHATKSLDEARRLRVARSCLQRLQKDARGELEGICWGCMRVRSVFFAECPTCKPCSPKARVLSQDGRDE